jgi:hypothetical protein
MPEPAHSHCLRIFNRNFYAGSSFPIKPAAVRKRLEFFLQHEQNFLQDIIVHAKTDFHGLPLTGSQRIDVVNQAAKPVTSR